MLINCERIGKQLTNVWLVVLVSTAGAFLIYAGIILLFESLSFDLVSILITLMIPIVISWPIANIIKCYVVTLKNKTFELERLDGMNKKLISVISHEIKSPLFSYLSLMSLLEGGCMDIVEFKKQTEKIKARAENVVELLESLLNWSKYGIERNETKKEFINPEELYNEVFELFDHIRKGKNIDLKIGALDNTIHSNRELVKFLFRNLYHNALKFTNENGVIQVYTEIRKGKTYTVVKDSGVGISEENIEHILDMDQWFTTSGTSNEAGTGFGINACRHFLEDNGG
ncbi:HAMP domain-containing histidine kinase, partial [Labilibacter sediminis]